MGIGTDRRQLVRQGPAAVHRVRGARGLHLLARAARARADRVRQGHADLHRDHRRGPLPADPARRLGPHLRHGHATSFAALQHRRTPTRSRPARPRPRAIMPPRRCCTGRTPRWPSARRWRCSCTRTRSPAVLSTRNRSVIRRNAALLPAYSFLLGLLALLGFVAIAAGVKVDQPAAGRAAAVRERVPDLVRRRRVRGHRDRRAGAGRDHVDRRREPVDPQHLQGLHQPRRHPRAGGAAGQGGLAAGEVRRAGVRARSVQRRTRSTCSCSAASGSCRPSRRSWSASTPGGSTDGRCSPAGRPGWSTGTWLAYGDPKVADPGSHFGGPLASSRATETTKSTSRFTALVLNLLVAVVLTVVLRAAGVAEGTDATSPERLQRRPRRRGRAARAGPGGCHALTPAE